MAACTEAEDQPFHSERACVLRHHCHPDCDRATSLLHSFAWPAWALKAAVSVALVWSPLSRPESWHVPKCTTPCEKRETHMTKSSIRRLGSFASCHCSCVAFFYVVDNLKYSLRDAGPFNTAGWQKAKGLGFGVRDFGFGPQLCQELAYDLNTFLKALNLSADNVICLPSSYKN